MNIAIIGTGWGARVQVPAFRTAGMEVSALAGHDADKTQRIAGELGVSFAPRDWRAVLERREVQLVSIVTPPDVHAEMAIAALEAGKHVLCEKPAALDAEQARRMLASAEAHPGRLALIDHELRFLPALVLARRMIADGAIGAVRLVVAQVINAGRADPRRPWNWWADAARGGGALAAAASHQVDTLRYLLGAEVDSVWAALDTFIGERPAEGGARAVTADDAFQLRLTFRDSARAAVMGAAVARLEEPNRMTLYGAEGTLRWSGDRLLHAPPGQALQDITPPHAHPPLAGLRGDFPYATVYLAHALRSFFDGNMQALLPAATFRDGLLVQQVLDAARRSNASGSVAAV